MGPSSLMSCEAAAPFKPADVPAAAKALLAGSFVSAARLGHLEKFLFEPLVVKSPGKKLGIDVQPVCVLGREGLGVKSVSPGGAVDAYNQSCNEGSQIKKGDTILGVSGLTGVAASRMMQELLTQTKLQLLVLSAQADGEGSGAAAQRGKKQARETLTGLASEAPSFSSVSTCASSYASAADASTGAFSMVSSSKRSGSSALEPQGFASAAAFSSDLAASAASYCSASGASDLIEPVRRCWVAATTPTASSFRSDDSRSASSAEDEQQAPVAVLPHVSAQQASVRQVGTAGRQQHRQLPPAALLGKFISDEQAPVAALPRVSAQQASVRQVGTAGRQQHQQLPPSALLGKFMSDEQQAPVAALPQASAQQASARQAGTAGRQQHRQLPPAALLGKFISADAVLGTAPAAFEDFLADMDAAPRILDIIRARNGVKKSKRWQAPLP